MCVLVCIECLDRFEKMEKGSLGSKYTDRTNPLDQVGPFQMSSLRIIAFRFTSAFARIFISAAYGCYDGGPRLVCRAACAPNVWQCRQGAHGEVWNNFGTFCQGGRQEPQAFGQQSALSVSRRLLARADHEISKGARPAHQAAMLPHEVQNIFCPFPVSRCNPSPLYLSQFFSKKKPTAMVPRVRC
jgi:hypothetical protein